MVTHKKTYSRLLINVFFLILINVLASLVFFRFDLTSDKRHSLSETSKDLLKNLDDIVYVKVYLEGDFPAGFTRLKNATYDLLNEFRSYSSYIEYEFIDPSDNTQLEERNNLYRQLYEEGLEPTNLQVQEKNGSSEQIVFPGAIIYYKGKSAAINFLQSQLATHPTLVLNNSIENLEYEFISSIYKVLNQKKPRIAFLEGNGELDKFERSGIQDALGTIKGSLSEFYKVESFNIKEFETDSLQKKPSLQRQQQRLNSYAAIMVAKPSDRFNELEKLLLDQYLMQGGKILWFLDGVSMDMDSLKDGRPYALALPKDLGLDDMLFKYGVRVNRDLILDVQSDKIPVVTGFQGKIPQQSLFPWFYNPLIISKEKHPISKNIDAIRSSFVSTIDTIKSSSVSKSIILKTSPFSKVVLSPHRVSLSLLEQQPQLEQYKSGEKIIGVLLEGSFNSYYENRLTSQKQAILTKSKATSMLVISDGDIIKNHVSKSGNPYLLGYNPFSKEMFKGNNELIINALHYMLGNKKLIEIRTNEFTLRMLDKEKIQKDRFFWQTLNMAMPSLIVVLFGIFWYWNRKTKFI